MKDIRKYFGVLLMMLTISAVLAMNSSTQADDFTKQDVERWTKEFIDGRQ